MRMCVAMGLQMYLRSAPSCVASGASSNTRFVAFKQHLDQFSRFSQLTRVPNHKQTNRIRATSVAIGRIQTWSAYDAA